MPHRSRLAGFIIDCQTDDLNMEAPTGQRFCVVRMKHPARGAAPNVW